MLFWSSIFWSSFRPMSIWKAFSWGRLRGSKSYDVMLSNQDGLQDSWKPFKIKRNGNPPFKAQFLITLEVHCVCHEIIFLKNLNFC